MTVQRTNKIITNQVSSVPTSFLHNLVILIINKTFFDQKQSVASVIHYFPVTPVMSVSALPCTVYSRCLQVDTTFSISLDTVTEAPTCCHVTGVTCVSTKLVNTPTGLLIINVLIIY